MQGFYIRIRRLCQVVGSSCPALLPTLEVVASTPDWTNMSYPFHLCGQMPRSTYQMQVMGRLFLEFSMETS